ncbi:MAG: CARDB domain-containing protein [Sneathiella sp.]
MWVRELKTVVAIILTLGIGASIAQAETKRPHLKKMAPIVKHQTAPVAVLSAKMADLIVLPFKTVTTGDPNTGICGNYNPKTGYKNVKFRVKNIGSASSAKSVLYVAFTVFGDGQQSSYWHGFVKNVPALLPGQSRVVKMKVPAAVQPNQYRNMIAKGAIDTYKQIPELSDTNNETQGHCRAPLG